MKSLSESAINAARVYKNRRLYENGCIAMNYWLTPSENSIQYGLPGLCTKLHALVKEFTKCAMSAIRRTTLWLFVAVVLVCLKE